MSLCCRTVVGTGAFLYRRAVGLTAAPAAGNAYGHVAEWLRSGLQILGAPSRPIPDIQERFDLSAHFECPSVLHPFLSLRVPWRSVAIGTVAQLSRTYDRVSRTKKQPSKLKVAGSNPAGVATFRTRVYLMLLDLFVSKVGVVDNFSGLFVLIPVAFTIACSASRA